jgi:uncharacterized membrane protein YpjA
MLVLLLIINIFGTAFGYYWYGSQLKNTPAIFWAFVPDSPTASLFFVFVLLAFLLKRNFGLMEALAIITLFKYGIWAVVMNNDLGDNRIIAMGRLYVNGFSFGDGDSRDIICTILPDKTLAFDSCRDLDHT